MKFSVTRKINLGKFSEDLYKYESEDISVEGADSPEEAFQKIESIVGQREAYYQGKVSASGKTPGRAPASPPAPGPAPRPAAPAAAPRQYTPPPAPPRPSAQATYSQASETGPDPVYAPEPGVSSEPPADFED